MATTFRRISKREAFRRFAAGERVVFCPRKLRPGFPFAPHSYIVPGDWLEAADRWPAGSKCWEGSREATAWGLAYRQWAYYNASWEAGYYPHYYLEV